MAEAKIYSALVGLMDDIGAIGKGQRNTQQGFAYRGIDDVMNALHPLLCKHRVITIPKVLEDRREQMPGRNGGTLLHSIVKLQVTLAAEDGSAVDAIVLGEGMDSGDKATNKAMSVAYKYAMFQLLCIPTEEMVDPDRDSPQVGTKPMQAAGKTPQQIAREAQSVRARQAQYRQELPTPMAEVQAARRENDRAQAKPIVKPNPPVCVRCHKAIENSTRMTAVEIAKWTREQSGASMCPDCFKAWKNE